MPHLSFQQGHNLLNSQTEPLGCNFASSVPNLSPPGAPIYMDSTSYSVLPSPLSPLNFPPFPLFAPLPSVLSKPFVKDANAKASKFTTPVKDSNVFQSNLNNPLTPVTPLSKKSQEYSIEHLLREPDKNKMFNDQLTPPYSPLYSTVNDDNFHLRVQETLLKTLESGLSSLHHVPAFIHLNNNIKLTLIKKSWLQIFLFSIYQQGVPLDSLSLYIQNVARSNTFQFGTNEANLIEDKLRKLQQAGIDSVEASYLKALAVFSKSKSLKQRIEVFLK